MKYFEFSYSTICVFMFLLICVGLFSCGDTYKAEPASVQVKNWEKVTLSFEGPQSSEAADENPFLNYRLNVTFKNGDATMVVPGFYAADGNAAESSSNQGNIWKVHFRPNKIGTWKYVASFRKGDRIAISDDVGAGEALLFDGQSGTIEVSENASHPGRIVTTEGHYLKYTDSGNYFLKGGADSPENFLAYHEFDGTEKVEPPTQRSGEAIAKAELHKYPPHVGDWKEGDPVWQGGKGKGIIGALNYLASEKMNSVYFLTLNIEGDGRDVWPYTGYEERLRFDCSKLDQWEIVFDHMDKLGLMLHVVTQETENEKLLDDGNTTFERKLYYRELIARFAHHLGVTWNMGEENGPANFSPNGQNTEQQKAMVEYFKTHDPYQNFVVIHTHSNPEHIVEGFEPLLGFKYLDGMSLQVGNPAKIHEVVKYWRDKSDAANRSWVLNLDELGLANRGIDPDDREDNNQDTMRGHVLWGNLMAGGGGVEWYFGYLNHDNDLGCEDWRTRDRLWDYTRFALEFFQVHLPFNEMTSRDELIDSEGDFCFAKAGMIYAIYFSKESECLLDLGGQDGNYSVQWYNPRHGGALENGSVTEVLGGSQVDLGNPSRDNDQDWVVLVKKK
jgi:hypothetical protein